MPVQMTETAIRAAIKQVATTGRMDLADAVEVGLRLRLTAAGGRSWVLACRDPFGRMRRFQLGEYGSSPKMGIADARKAAQAMRVKVRDGADPVADAKRLRQIGQQGRDGVGTLAALLDLYARQQGHKRKSWTECRRRIDSVFAPFLNKPVITLKVGDIQMQADGWKSSQSAAAAVRYLRPVLKWAAQSGRSYASDELGLIVPPTTVRRRKRVLSNAELAAVLPVLKTSARPYDEAMRFMLLTLARREEAATARWRDVNMTARTWTLSHTKNGEPHVIPLSRQAMDLLRSRLSVDADGQPQEPFPEALIFATSTGTKLANWDRATKQIIVDSGLGTSHPKTGAILMNDGSQIWTRHDLRRTGATLLGDLGELPDIIEAALNHVNIHSALAAGYNRSRYRPQVAAALQQLADALDRIETGAAMVVQMAAHDG